MNAEGEKINVLLPEGKNQWASGIQYPFNQQIFIKFPTVPKIIMANKTKRFPCEFCVAVEETDSNECK